MTPGYHVHVSGIGRTHETVRLDEDGDREAVLTAFGACSALGHSLWSGGRFLGYFEPGVARIGDATLMREAVAEAMTHGLRQ